MKKFDLSFCFKGERQYIHGTDMLQKSMDLLREQFQVKFLYFDFTIHRMSEKNLALYLYSPEQSPEFLDQDIAVIKFGVLDKPWEARLRESETQPDCRYPYDEDRLIRECVFNNAEQSIQLQHESCYSTIETLVAMTKALHHNIYPNLNTSWAFCRWESLHWPLGENLFGVNIRLIQALGTRLTKSEVCVNGATLGHIYFSARTK